MLSPSKIPNNFYVTGSGSFTLSDEDTIRYETLRNENRLCCFIYQVGCYIYGTMLSILAIPFLFFNYTRTYALIYIAMCIIWTIWYRNYIWNKWSKVTNRMNNFPNNHKF